MSSDKPNTLEKIERAYEKRERIPKKKYSFLNPSVFIPWQKRKGYSCISSTKFILVKKY